MIKLSKLPIPTKLARNGAAWLEKYLAATTKKQRDAALVNYRCAEIKDALKQETGNKCAYCESSMLHVTYGDVEHIIPKVVDSSKIFEWNNLTLVCDKCNTNKGEYFEPTLPLVNPYADNPTDHLFAWGFIVKGKPESDRSIITIEQLGLNRQSLIEKRKSRIESLESLLISYQKAPEINKPIIKRQITQELSKDKEYIMFTHEYIKRAGLDILLE